MNIDIITREEVDARVSAMRDEIVSMIPSTGKLEEMVDALVMSFNETLESLRSSLDAAIERITEIESRPIMPIAPAMEIVYSDGTSVEKKRPTMIDRISTVPRTAWGATTRR